MTTVKELTAQRLTDELGIPEQICEAFLYEVRRREPEAKVTLQTTETLNRVSIEFEFGDYLDMERRDGFVVISSAGGLDQHLTLIPKGGVTDVQAAWNYLTSFDEIELVADSALDGAISVRMQHVYERIQWLRTPRWLRSVSPRDAIVRWRLRDR